MDIFKAEKTGHFREFTEKAFSSLQQGALPLRCSLEGCKPETHRNSREKEKPGSHLISMLPGVEVAGFRFAPQRI